MRPWGYQVKGARHGTAGRCLRVQLADSKMLDRQFSKWKKSRHADSKGLTSRAFFPLGDSRISFSDSSGRLKRGDADLLILKGLLASLLRRTGGGLMNLKDLLALLAPRPPGDHFGLCRTFGAL